MVSRILQPAPCRATRAAYHWPTAAWSAFNVRRQDGQHNLACQKAGILTRRKTPVSGGPTFGLRPVASYPLCPGPTYPAAPFSPAFALAGGPGLRQDKDRSEDSNPAPVSHGERRVAITPRRLLPRRRDSNPHLFLLPEPCCRYTMRSWPSPAPVGMRQSLAPAGAPFLLRVISPEGRAVRRSLVPRRHGSLTPRPLHPSPRVQPPPRSGREAGNAVGVGPSAASRRIKCPAGCAFRGFRLAP